MSDLVIIIHERTCIFLFCKNLDFELKHTLWNGAQGRWSQMSTQTWPTHEKCTTMFFLPQSFFFIHLGCWLQLFNCCILLIEIILWYQVCDLLQGSSILHRLICSLMRPYGQQCESMLVQIMFSSLFNRKQLPKPMLSYCQLAWEQASVQLKTKYAKFLSQKPEPL